MVAVFNYAALCAAAVLPLALFSFGSIFYLGPRDDNAYITKATYSLKSPSTITNFDTSDFSLWIAIWIGVQSNKAHNYQENLVQPLLNWCANQKDCSCSARESEWCVAASTFTSSGLPSSSYVCVAEGAKLDFEIAVNEQTGNVDQKVWLERKLVAQHSHCKFKQL